ncbi:bifunctional heptose 7-phosphate kinase/heptose 1-phosphate adenyltransferase [Desulfonatronovibrio hydrogenovorans]|uniref:bifunctional heptose 7-phosphate kinase/heptose 1-phosphate adenyltransferase n=1 Tax=Desulfonatronovibrio hydrogenovorans TaxID=53245 RepID=UPI000491367F|nr:PfkB family carbohydrate kinase [Desulfonatronovibrio hydrogenovorans]
MKEELKKKLNRINNQPLVIWGDVILDHYQWGEVSRISPEAPVPVVRVESETYRLGGAANVARNIKSVGGKPSLIGLIGRDKFGDQVQEMLSGEGILNNLHSSLKRNTTLKTRVMGNNQQIVRVDTESRTRPDKNEISGLAEAYKKSLKSGYAVISDYGKGVINPQTLHLASDKKLIIDPKNNNFKNYKQAFIMTPNKKEAQEGSGIRLDSKEEIIKAGKKIIAANELENLLITMGPDGMVLFQKNGSITHISTSARKVFDVTGAGDTVIGVLAICLEAEIDLLASCILANYAAGIVVGEIGTVATTKDDIIKSIQELETPAINQWV